ncbi:unnamed protein product, partial [Rotaria sordida]
DSTVTDSADKNADEVVVINPPGVQNRKHNREHENSIPEMESVTKMVNKKQSNKQNVVVSRESSVDSTVTDSADKNADEVVVINPPGVQNRKHNREHENSIPEMESVTKMVNKNQSNKQNVVVSRESSV